MIILKNEHPIICSLAGTHGKHDSGQFIPYTSCYDRRRQKFLFPFGKLPFGLDHGSISFIPKGTCHNDPAKFFLLTFRTESYGTSRTEMLGFDIPTNGWTLDELQSGRYRTKVLESGISRKCGSTRFSLEHFSRCQRNGNDQQGPQYSQLCRRALHPRTSETSEECIFCHSFIRCLSS
jgi:hypothetical protein